MLCKNSSLFCANELPRFIRFPSNFLVILFCEKFSLPFGYKKNMFQMN